MAKEYLGAESVTELFDIIADNFVSREEIENRDKSLTASINVASALIAASVLEVAKEVKSAAGEAGGGKVSDELVAADSEVDEVIGKYFEIGGN